MKCSTCLKLSSAVEELLKGLGAPSKNVMGRSPLRYFRVLYFGLLPAFAFDLCTQFEEFGLFL